MMKLRDRNPGPDLEVNNGGGRVEDVSGLFVAPATSGKELTPDLKRD
jgi:hypothetical protein